MLRKVADAVVWFIENVVEECVRVVWHLLCRHVWHEHDPWPAHVSAETRMRYPDAVCKKCGKRRFPKK